MNKFFQFSENGTDLRTEILAGVTTFLATAYIIVVNPIILQKAGMPFNGVLTATVLISAVSSILMGLFGKNPIVLAPGMGINAFFTFTVVLGMGVKWETALGTVFWSGIIFLLLSIFNIREKIVEAIPTNLRKAIACGIGLFIALIGFINSGFITASPATILTHAKMNPSIVTFVIGLGITIVFTVKNVRGALLLGILSTMVLSIPLGRIWGDSILVQPSGIFAAPDFSLFFALDIWGALKFAYLPVIFSFLFTDLFDTLSTFVGVAEAGNLMDENGQPRNMKQSLIVDSIATFLSGIFGTSSTTSYIESAAGIQAGGRTGMVAVVAGLLFLPFMFFSPLLSMVPTIATAPVLIIVGVFMTKPIKGMNWSDMEEAIPAFLAMILIPISYSITYGIIWGFLSYTLIKIAKGKMKELPPTLLAIDALAIFSFFL